MGFKFAAELLHELLNLQSYYTMQHPAVLNAVLTAGFCLHVVYEALTVTPLLKPYATENS